MRPLLPVLILSLSLLSFSTELRAAEESLPSSVTAAAGEEDLGKQLGNFFVPTHTCPYCHKEFSEKSSLLMLIIGFVGQALFTSRFIVQWIASEKRRQSYIPIVFWYLSIVGSLMLLAYAISILAWPIILGQCFGVIVYGRNLVLITRAKNQALLNLKSEVAESDGAESLEALTKKKTKQ